MCCNESGRYYHPDERKANQKIVHFLFFPLFWLFSACSRSSLSTFESSPGSENCYIPENTQDRESRVITIDPIVLLPPPERDMLGSITFGA